MTGPTQPYFPGQYPQPAYYAPPRFRGLERGQKRSAFWAGALGLNLMGFGFSVMVFALLFGGLAAAIARFSSSADRTSGLRGFDEFLRDNAAMWILGAAAVGAVALLIGMFVSVTILRTGSVRRPFAVTWSAFGISLPVLGFLTGIGSFVAQIVGLATSVIALQGPAGTTDGAESAFVVVAVVSVLVSAVVTGIVGWLAWWWMAHAFRERIPVGVGPSTTDRPADDQR